ncbi:MAG: methylmalonyl-CoA carboxyltransferase [Firmicutes bacterium HGW-Firmicutes-13]|nr:MAG: methylmalonyl-CoA carboxyltransferase [Firmicutes bacterium HGW-Firmicutes-13]
MDVESKLKYLKEARDRHVTAEDGGKPSARKRIESILDENSFLELSTFMKTEQEEGKEIIAGAGTIDSRPIYIFAQDVTSNNGILSDKAVQKILCLIKQAGSTGTPLIGVLDGLGVQIKDGLKALKFYGKLFSSYAAYSGVIPLITFAAGSCPGGLSFIAGLSDFVIGIKGRSNIFLNSPGLVKDITGEDITLENLSGTGIHTEKSGLIHFTADKEEEAFQLIKELISYLPLNHLEESPLKDTDDDINRISPKLAEILLTDDYDVRDVVKEIADNHNYLEVQENYAPNLVVGFMKLNGYSLGVIANQPKKYSGSLDVNSCIKGSRFIRFCDAFNIPLLTLVDVPGFLPTAYQEQSGIVSHGAKLLFAYGEANIPMLTLILNKGYGTAGVTMGSKFLGVDLVLAWPTAQIGALTPKGLSGLLSIPDEESEKIVSPYEAAAHGMVDDIIDPGESRARIIYGLEFLKNKKRYLSGKKHGNFPL